MSTSPVILAKVQARVRALTSPDAVQGPFPDMCACDHPKWSHTGKNWSGKCTADCACSKWRKNVIEARALEAIAADGRNIMSVFREHERNEHRRTAQVKEPGQIRVGASDAGACKRRIWYKNFAHTLPDYRDAFVDDQQALMGQAIHKSFLDAVKAIYPWRQIEMELAVPGFDRRVRIDIFDPVMGVVEDLKTAGDGKYRMLVDGPTDATWQQVRIYGYGLEEAGYLVNELRLVYVHREAGKPEVFTEPYDRALALEAVNELVNLGDLLAAGVVPEREGDGPGTGFPCDWCPARNHCWNVPQAAAAGRGPVSLTLLGPSPEDEKVEWALTEYRRGQAIENEGKAIKAKNKLLLDGIEPGRYGRLVWAEDVRWEKDTNAYIRALENALVTPESLRPSMDALQQVADRRFPRSAQSVRPVRKAILDKEAKERAKITAAVERAAATPDTDTEPMAGGDAA